MNNIMAYKDYIGSVEFSEADMVFYGKVQGIRSLISYEGTNVDELVTDFHEAVDSYLESCAANGDEPETAFKGKTNMRFRNREQHKKAAIYAMNHNQSLNSFINDAIDEKLAAANA
ncbi:MAG: type II toxin-antitoxin system HicB family antitoxin [Lachnospiraceae bacterium]|nr:type II toxin-antitoxin system HicB family antitoxin [Lachnospiraceae bacterium]